MRNILITALLLITAVSCSSQKNKAKIEGKIDTEGKTTLVLKVLNINTQNVVDTIITDAKGLFKYSVADKGKSPEFYYLYHNNNRLASLVLKAGDAVRITADTTGVNTTIEGSEESLLLAEIQQKLSDAQSSFDVMVNRLQSATQSGNDAQARELNEQLGRFYVKQKQEAIKSIYTNPGSITNMVYLYYRFAPELPLFGDLRDVLLLRRVYDSIQAIYPASPYLGRLLDDINSRENADLLTSKILDASESGFPEVVLPDNKAVMQRLSDLSGKVIILSFWSIADPAQRMMNLDFKDLYEKYNNRGLEIYQISVDTDKTAWATAVAEQQLPWISVCDGFGANSMAVSTYNIQQVPTLFVIDKSGNIVERDIYDDRLERKIRELL